MKQFLTVIAVIIIAMIGCEKQAKQSSAPNTEFSTKKGGKGNSPIITTGLPTLFITASASGATVTWSGLPDTVHVTQIAICSDTTFINTDPLNPITFVANLYLQNPVTSTSNYVTSFTIPSSWFSGTRFVRIQGDYYVNNVSGLYFSNTLQITLP